METDAEKKIKSVQVIRTQKGVILLLGGFLELFLSLFELLLEELDPRLERAGLVLFLGCLGLQFLDARIRLVRTGVGSLNLATKEGQFLRRE